MAAIKQPVGVQRKLIHLQVFLQILILYLFV